MQWKQAAAYETPAGGAGRAAPEPAKRGDNITIKPHKLRHPLTGEMSRQKPTKAHKPRQLHPTQRYESQDKHPEIHNKPLQRAPGDFRGLL